MQPSLISNWLKVIAPDLLDKIIMDKVFRPIAERTIQGERQ